MILRYLFTNAFFCRNVLRANILAMLRFQSVVTVSLLNKIKFYNHNAVTMWVCVCVFFIEQCKSNAQVCFFLFYHYSLETRKVAGHFGCDLKIALHISFWICPPKMIATFLLFWMRSLKQRLVSETRCCFLEHTNYRGSTTICNNNTHVNKVVKNENLLWLWCLLYTVPWYSV